jgi:hypothetical protein
MNTYNITNRRDIEPGVYWYRMSPEESWEVVVFNADRTVNYIQDPISETIRDLVIFCPNFEFVGPLEPPA